MLKAKTKDILKKLKDVDKDVLPMFDDTADILIRDCKGDTKKALQIALAYGSGHYKQVLPTKSLITGRDGQATFKMNVEDGKTLDETTAIEIIKKYWNPRMAENCKNMKSLKNRTGVVFDLRQGQEADGFLENYEHLKETNAKRVDFTVSRCITLPDVEGGGSNGYGSKGGYGGGRGGDRDYNGSSRGAGGGGYNSRGGDRGGDRGDRQGGGDGWGNSNSRSNNNGGNNGWGNAPSGSGWNQTGSYNVFPSASDFKPKQSTELFNGGSSRYSQNTAESTPQHSQQAEKTTKSSVIYLANLSYEVNEQDIMEYLADFKPVRAKLLMDGEGKSKGSGFVQLSSSSDAHRAITSL